MISFFTEIVSGGKRQVKNNLSGPSRGKSNFLLKSLFLILKRCNLEMSRCLWLGCGPGHLQGTWVGPVAWLGAVEEVGRDYGLAGSSSALKARPEGEVWAGRLWQRER